jgi:radical SAM superfamily enzyme YgiQ (UPF0313 family)
MLVFPPVANVRFTNNICALPMGIASLAAYLVDRTDVEVAVLDSVVEGHDKIEDLDEDTVKFGLGFDDIQKRVREFGPDLLGVSTVFSSQFPFVREIISRARADDPDIFAVTGGSYPSFAAERCINTSGLDAVVIGEGELPLKNIILRINAGDGLEGLSAVAHRTGAGAEVNSDRLFIEDLDDLPLPARDLFPVEKYFRVNLPMQAISKSRRNISVATSRGCPYKCRFCSSTIHWGGRYRMRSVENVLDEFSALKENYDVREVKFEDDNLTFDRDRAKALFRGMIERGFDFKWNTPNGIAVRHLDDEMLGLMKDSGCYELTLAVESGDPEVLKNIIHKPLDLAEARAAAARIKAHGIETAGYFIIGFPGETRKQVENTLRFAVGMELDRVYIFMYTPLPGTELADKALRKGLVREGFDFEKENNYFLPSVKLDDLSWEEMLRMQRRAFWRSNLRLLYKRPHRFIGKYGHTIVRHPEMVWKFFSALRH